MGLTCKNIADLFASNLKYTLNTHSPSPHISFQSTIQTPITPSDICCVAFSAEDVLEAVSHLKAEKSDGDKVYAEHLLFASSALISPLADFFSSLVCHGFIPQCLQDCAKKNKGVFCSSI